MNKKFLAKSIFWVVVIWVIMGLVLVIIDGEISKRNVTFWLCSFWLVPIHIYLAYEKMCTRENRNRRREALESKNRLQEGEKHKLVRALDMAFGKPIEVAVPILNEVGVRAVMDSHGGTCIVLPNGFWELGHPHLVAEALVVLVKSLPKDWRSIGYSRIACVIEERLEIDPLFTAAVLAGCMTKDGEACRCLEEFIRRHWLCRV